MKQITIEIPDNCELQQNGNTYTIVEKQKRLTYNDIAKTLFSELCFYINTGGGIDRAISLRSSLTDLNNCISERQAEKLLAINQLMNVAKYLNGDWQPDWNNEEEAKYYIQIENVSNNLNIDCTGLFNSSIVYFKSKEFAEEAIDILGEEVVKLALCTDY